MKYGYQSEKLSAARRCLMLPHTSGIESSIADAFHECSLAFHKMDEDGLDDGARRSVSKIKDFMDTTGIAAPSGAWAIKARSLSTDEQIELSLAVDELAHWFDRKFWED